MKIILASGSPRRAMLLRSADVTFDVRRPDIDEQPRDRESPVDYVARLSHSKAIEVAGPGEIVVGADTTVDVGGRILEKPIDDDDAHRMLRLLSGRTHHVHTSVCVIGRNGPTSIVVTTAVTFAALTTEVIEWYVATGEPVDKAGAYAIQERGAALVERVDGSVTNVVGLPLVETLALLRAAQ